MTIERLRGPRPKVVIAGGGVAGLEAALALRHHAVERVELELISPSRHFVYKPLATAERFGVGETLRFDVERIAADCGAAYRPDALASVDSAAKRVWTRAGEAVDFDALVIACGARMRPGFPGALTFWGGSWVSVDEAAFSTLLKQIERGGLSDLIFALPGGANWPLPLYELALLSAARAGDGSGLSITIVTPEAAPLAMFGTPASERIAELLAERGITVLTNTYPEAVENGHLRLVPSGRLAADRVVTLPRLEGRRIGGVPHDRDGFIDVDPHGAVHGLTDVYAAGDGIAFGIKQGGIATQQADAVAEHIAARAGAPIEPRPFSPVLRGLLLTGGAPRFLRHEATGGKGEAAVMDTSALWWPPGKIAGRFLAPYLATGANHALEPPPAGEGAVPVVVELA
jgi:sulfide:quinone oxidoreductase